MGNILNFNVNKIDMRLSNYDYWDLYLAKGDYSVIPKDNVLSGDCLVAHFDFNDDAIYRESEYTNQYTNQYGSLTGLAANTIYSLFSSTWNGAVNTGYTLSMIGLTGLDNGLLPYAKNSGDTTNSGLTAALTGTTLIIPSGETRLIMNRVTGYTGNFIYPLEVITETGTTIGASVGQYSQLCGGFYQGYYKLDGYSYQVLPNRVPKSWVAEIWLRKPSVDSCVDTGTTLNDIYTGNTGFFLYFGTRAENKFWDIFEGLNTGTTSGCTSGATEWCTIPKETDVSFVDDAGRVINLSPPPMDYTVTDNGFLIYSRATSNPRCGNCGIEHREGYTTCTFTGGSITIATTREVVTDNRNPFLVYSRASDRGCGSCGGEHASGETVCSFSGFTSPELELDKDADLIDNALGFRIKEDGSIGYRKLIMTVTCVNNVTVTGCTIEEAYSASGIVTNDQWHMVSIKFVANTTLDECELEWKPARKGKLMFYVDAKLKFVVENFEEFIAKRLLEHKDKQLTVPYNISLGGGTQGLIEEMTFDGPDSRDLGSCLDENFAGTFIGDISQFRFYICGMDFCNISNNFTQERVRYQG